MALSDLEERKARQFILYFPSARDRERWRRLARKARMPLSRWIYEMVERRLAEEKDGHADSAFIHKSNLITENRRLQRDLEKSEARIKELETEIWKLKNQYFARFKGTGSFDPALLNILKSGGTWSSRELLNALGIDPNDIDAIELVTNQLYLLLDLNLVRETSTGWRWIQ